MTVPAFSMIGAGSCAGQRRSPQDGGTRAITRGREGGLIEAVRWAGPWMVGPPLLIVVHFPAESIHGGGMRARWDFRISRIASQPGVCWTTLFGVLTGRRPISWPVGATGVITGSV